MPHQPSLFGDEPVPPTPAPSAQGAVDGRRGVVLSALQSSGGKPDAGQQKFQRLLERAESLAARIAAAQALAESHRQQSAAALHPLQEQHKALLREMVLWLDARLTRPGLTRAQQRSAESILCSAAAALALGGDQAMRALHDAHAEHTLDESQRQEAAAAQTMVEELLGQPLEVEVAQDDPEAIIQAALAQLQAQAEAQQNARAAARARHQAARARAGGRKPAQPPAAEADSTLRSIYRQLASALHPDRESDPQERERKTGLMSEANAAYARRDLPALLQLLVHAELADGPMLARLARDRLAALCLLLQERADWLAGELQALESAMRYEFDLPARGALTEAALRRRLRDERDGLAYAIAHMQQDLRRVRDDAEFKRWLREQEKLSRA